METPLLKIASIRRCIRRIKDIVSHDTEIKEINTQDLVVLNIQRACEQTIDLANWICAYRNFSIPRTSREVFSILESEGVITENLSDYLRKMVGFRNIAIHEYQEINQNILKSLIKHRLGDFEVFIEQISQHLQIFSTSKSQDDRINNILTPTLRKVSLDGDDLGDDYKIDLNILGRDVSTEIKIKTGQTVEIKKILSHFLIPDEGLRIPVKIQVKELDPISDDIGSGTLILEKGQETGWDQLIVKEILVQGKGGREKNRSAMMTIELDCQTNTNIFQIIDCEPNGWVIALNQTGTKIQLPAGIRVKLLESSKNREFFEIQEGFYKSTVASISSAPQGQTHLIPTVETLSGCKLKFDQSKSILHIEDLGDFAAITHQASQGMISGEFLICLPDTPHQGGRKYRSQARHAETWFKIGDEGDRYIHPGRITRGCITIQEIDKWETVYNYLMRHRFDDLHVGKIEIF